MWILSQDGTLIVNADTAHGIGRIDNIIYISHAINARVTIGVYSTPEKAKVVMEQIISARSGLLILNNVEISEDDERALPKHSDARYIPGDIVFRMPADEDMNP